MKRLFFILLFFGALLLSSCQREYGILDYQKKDILAECVINGEYRVELKKEGDTVTVTAKEPQEISGVTFEIKDGVFISFGDMEIEMERESLTGICAIGEMFSQSEECLTSATEQGSGSVLTFETELCHYQITIGPHSVPKHIKILSESYEYDVEILAIQLQ